MNLSAFIAGNNSRNNCIYLLSDDRTSDYTDDMGTTDTERIAELKKELGRLRRKLAVVWKQRDKAIGCVDYPKLNDRVEALQFIIQSHLEMIKIYGSNNE